MSPFQTLIPTWLAGSARAGSIGNYPEMRPNNEKPERVNHDLWEDVVKVIVERMSNVCVGAFGIPPLLTIYTY